MNVKVIPGGGLKARRFTALLLRPSVLLHVDLGNPGGRLPVFDCTGVCPYDNLPYREWTRTGDEGRPLSRLGSLLHYWFLNAKRLFHMLIGLVFMALTLAGASLTLAEWQGYRKYPEQGLVHFYMFGGFTMLLATLCLYSFLKARNVH